MNKILQLVSYVLNGINFASYDLEGDRYRAENIKQRQQIMIPNLPRNKVVRVDLLGELKFNLLVTGIDIDLKEDDTKELRSDSGSNNTSPNFRLYVSVVNRKTDNVVKRLAFLISSYPDYTNEIILEPNFIYDIKVDRDVNLLTFTGEPVYMRDNIIFLNGVAR